MTRKEMTEQFDLFDSLIAAPEKLFTDDIERNVFRFISSCRTDDGKSLGDKVIKYLETIPCFSMCYLSWSSMGGIKVIFPPLEYGPYEYHSFSVDCYPIMYIDLLWKTYTIYDDAIEYYKLMYKHKPKLETYTIDSFYEQFLDTSFRARLSKIRTAIHSDKKPLTRLQDVVFWIKYPYSRAKNTVSEKIENEKSRIATANEKAKQRYEKEVYKYAFVSKQALGYVHLINEKQDQIVEFLKSINSRFRED